MSETDKDILGLLQELKAAGEQDSAGSFTIDPAKAREKFREFGLGEVHEYTCVLVGALIAGGASFLDLEADSDDFIVSSDFYATHHELEQLFSLASGGSDDVHFFRLALGLQAALALEPQKVELVCWDGKRGSRLKLGTEQLTVEVLQDSPWKDNRVRSRLHVREKPGLRVVGRFVRKAMKAEATPEQELLQERCRLSPVPITLNGELLNQELSLEHCQAYLVLSPDTEKLGREPRLPNVPHRRLPSEDFTAYVFFTEGPKDELAEVVLSGLKMPGWPLEYANRVLLYSNTLATDISLSQLVEDAKLESIQEQIRSAMVETLPEWLEGPLSYANSFPTREGEQLSYRQLKVSYERFGFLTVIDNYGGPPHGEAPLLKSGPPFLDLLFPEQVKNEAILGLLPPGQYRARKRLPNGAEIGLIAEPQPEPTGTRGNFVLRTLRWLVKSESAEPELSDILALYEKAPLKSICLTETLELLRFVLARSTPIVRTIAELMNEPSSPFGLDPESFLSRLVAQQSLSKLGGAKVSLERLVGKSHTYWKQFTDYPLRFERPHNDPVSVPESQHSALMSVVGYTNINNFSHIRSGLIDTSGELVCEPEAVRRGKRVQCGRIEYSAGDVGGFTDADGVPIIEALDSQITEFQDGYAVVQSSEGDYRLMDTEGHFVGPRCEFISDLHDGLRLASQSERCGYLNNSGEIAIPFELKSGGHFGEGEALVTRSGRRLFIDHKGNELRECRSDVEFMGPLKEGVRMSHVDGIWGFVDRDGEWVIRPRFTLTAPPCQGLIPACLGELWGLINTKGEAVVPFQHDWMDLRFSEDLIAFGNPENYGFLDRDGQEVLTGFQRCGAFHEGLAPARDGSKWGFINRDGEFVIEPKFLSANTFNEGRAVVSVYNS